MHAARDGRYEGRHAVTVATLFLCLFASQGALIVMSPVLVQAASDLHVSTAAAGQLRTVTGLTAGVTALLLGPLAGRVELRRQLAAATALLALGSLASAVAPTFAALALAQVPVGVAVAVLTSSATLAAAEWVPAERRVQALSVALVGQPAAWIAGMPLIGLLGEHSWRLGWLALPLAAAIPTAILLATRERGPATAGRAAPLHGVLKDRPIACWLGSELLANAAWAGTLVYSGALFVESYGTSTRLTGVLLACAAVAYVAGNLGSRRIAARPPVPYLTGLALALALLVGLFGVIRPGALTSTLLLSGAAVAAGGRTLVSSSFALSADADVRPVVTSLRAATMQLGYFAGSIAGGAGLAFGGYAALGAVMCLLFLGAAAVLAVGSSARARALGPAPAPA